MENTTALELFFLNKEDGSLEKPPVRLEIIKLKNGCYTFSNFYEYNLQQYVLIDWLNFHKASEFYQKSYQQYIQSNKQILNDDVKKLASDIPSENISKSYQVDSFSHSTLNFEDNKNISLDQQTIQLENNDETMSENDSGNRIVEGKSGGIFEGHLVSHKANGFGCCTWPNGDKYIGEWKNDEKEGKGCYIWGDGAYYIGDYKLNLPSGKGEYRYSNGDKFCGTHKKDSKEGYGEYTYKNGDIFKGYYKKGKQNGEGVFILKDGKHEEQIWNDGKRLK